MQDELYFNGGPGRGDTTATQLSALVEPSGTRAAIGPADLPADLHARFFRALGDPTRVRLLQALLDAPSGECSVGELVMALGVAQGRVSTHLGCLRWCGLVQARREGKQVYYRVGDPRVRDLLGLAGALVHDHAAGVASCGMIR
ncbi:MAG: ArsR/SmtB family transcription factor [Ktedonobacterales bacterium]